MIEKVLTDIGLSDKEARLYLAALRLGSQSASVIARYTGINRTTVYDLFDGLIKKGLATKIDKGAAVYFQVLDPQNLISYLEREKVEYARRIDKKKQEVAEVLPAIQSIERAATTRPKVQFFEGEKGMREAYEDTLTAIGPICAYANVEEMHKGLPDFFPEYYQRRREKNIAIRAIAPDNSLSLERHRHDKEELRQMILIPRSKYSFSPELNIYNDKVLIASWKEKMAIIIQSEEIADLHRKIYDLVWSKINPVEKF